MADQTYVEISKFTVKEIFEDKYTAKVIEVMTKAAEAAVEGKLATRPPKEAGAKGWSVLGSLVSLGPSKDGKKFGAKVSLTVATWPAKSIKAMPSGEAAFGAAPNDKFTAADAEKVAKTATEEAMKTAVSFMTSKKPE